MESGSPDCLRDSLFQASSSQLPSSRLSSRLSHHRSASPRPSLDRRNADAGTAAPSHHQATTREIGRGPRQTAEVCLWTENTMASFQDSAASRCLGRRRHWAGALSPSLQHLVIHGAPSLLPGMRQRALGILPPWLPPSLAPSLSPVSLCLATNDRMSRWHTTGWTIRTTSLLSLPWKQLERQPCISMCARPISSAVCWAFSFCRRRPGTRYVTHHWSSADCRFTQARGRPFLARERVPAAHRSSSPVSGGGL